jgi:hypothetical protein
MFSLTSLINRSVGAPESPRGFFNRRDAAEFPGQTLRAASGLKQYQLSN